MAGESRGASLDSRVLALTPVDSRPRIPSQMLTPVDASVWVTVTFNP